ncbi:MAG: DEAD/DEAH box helicase family protein [Candidatus Thorarchaeota archaeon]|jgi:superfamily II DNA or RNA helicase
MEVIKRSGLLISREYKNQEFYQKIKDHLIRRTQAYQTSNYIINTFYLESEKFLLVPRLFPIHNYVNCKIINAQHNGKPINISHNITPRNETQRLAIDYILENENTTLELPPGVGKTVISIYMIAERKKKSIILVHRDSLADQWRDRFLTFTNLKKNDIARLTSQTYKNDLKKPITIITVQTFLSLLKRQRRDFLIELNNANIGIFVADEVHTSVGAPTFSECSIHIPARYTYGLSATPYRFDGNGDIIEYHLGKVFSNEDTEGTMDVKVTVFLLDYQIDIPERYKYIYWGGNFQRARYLNLMKKSKPFIFASRELLKRFKNERNIIFMAERIKLLENLYNWLKHDSKSKFYGSGTLEALNSKITFATPGKGRDGIDAPHKDCLIMTSPISNIKQLSGRIVREHKNKKTPIIIDMVDYGCERIARTFNSRYDYYKKKNWDIRYILIKDNLLYKINHNRAMEIIRGR